jgi:NitT/TauT family transport system substrate-binding protein
MTTVRIPTGTLICNAPTYIADELLRAERFTDIQHVPTTTERVGPEAIQRGELDFAMAYTPNVITAIESSSPVTVLAGVHVGCNSFFAHEGIRTIRDLKGKKVSAGNQAQRSLIASMAAYVGLDPFKDIEWVSSPFATAKELFVERKIDASLPCRPTRRICARNIGRVIVNSALDRPWSQHFCCVFIATKEFVGKYPVAIWRPGHRPGGGRGPGANDCQGGKASGEDSKERHARPECTARCRRRLRTARRQCARSGRYAGCHPRSMAHLRIPPRPWR